MTTDDTVPATDDAAQDDRLARAEAAEQSKPEAETSPAAADLSVAEPTVVEAAGMLDYLPLLLPFVRDPSKLPAMVGGLEQVVRGETLLAKWDGVDQCARVALPLIDDFIAARRTGVAVAEAEVLTFEEAHNRVEAQKLGDGKWLRKLRGLIGEAANSDIGKMLIELLLKQAAGALLPVG